MSLPLYFKFMGLEVEGSRIIARIRELEGGDWLGMKGVSLFGVTSYTNQDESQLANLIKVFDESKRWGNAKSRQELVKAFSAIRTEKARNGISFDVPAG